MNRQYQDFYEKLWEYYESHGRHELPWRQADTNDTFDAYKIMVSEIMLQQTQVARVIPKYVAFLTRFPTIQALGEAQLGDVLRAWQGLGYNRRAKFLWQAAQKVVDDFGMVIPSTEVELVSLPGIGKNTAGAIRAYAFNQPAVFIETNIRTVYIHHFFADKQGIDDKELVPLIEQTLDADQPRIFYWALMDYGTHLKQVKGNLSKLSNSYAKQSKFHGSKRQIRGAVIRKLSNGNCTYSDLIDEIQDERLDEVLGALVAEGLIAESGKLYRL